MPEPHTTEFDSITLDRLPVKDPLFAYARFHICERGKASLTFEEDADVDVDEEGHRIASRHYLPHLELSGFDWEEGHITVSFFPADGSSPVVYDIPRADMAGPIHHTLHTAVTNLIRGDIDHHLHAALLLEMEAE